MKLRITITGTKVHDVGYRYLLLGGAMSMHLPGFCATNLTDPKGQMVEVLLEGKEPQVKAFIDFMQNNKPANALVSDITTSEYDDEIPRRTEYAQDLTALQMLKAIPTILDISNGITDIKKDTVDIKNNTKYTLEEIRGLRQDQPSFAMQLRQLQQDIEAIKAQLKMP
jgi:acylphosphatase